MERLDRHDEQVVLIAAHGGRTLGLEKAHDPAREASRADGASDDLRSFAEELLLNGAADHADGGTIQKELRLHFALLEGASVDDFAVVDRKVVVVRADHARLPVAPVGHDRHGLGGLRRHGDDARDLALERIGVLEREVRRAHALARPHAKTGTQHQLVVAEGLDLRANGLRGPVADRHHRDHGHDADHDAEHGEQASERISTDLAHGQHECIPDHDAASVLLSLMSRPSLKTRWRFA